jgi:hypothetical protein
VSSLSLPTAPAQRKASFKSMDASVFGDVITVANNSPQSSDTVTASALPSKVRALYKFRSEEPGDLCFDVRFSLFTDSIFILFVGK